MLATAMAAQTLASPFSGHRNMYLHRAARHGKRHGTFRDACHTATQGALAERLARELQHATL